MPEGSSSQSLSLRLRRGLLCNFALAFVPVKLLLKARLSIGSSRQGGHWNFEFPATKGADPDRWSAA
jgi:hypothetical protein